ncbi:MAG: DUF4388 domain-containing protein [Sandaracinaceae bacterium]|nr:DUF4388 domain-containing protein [Sandaracinaceae bacterium]
MHVLRWLRDEGAISASQFEGAVHHAARTGRRVEEALLDIGALGEADLLKLLAERYETRFVSTERLASSKIPRRVLELVPFKLAERLQVFPILFEQGGQTLSIVTAAPGEEDCERQVAVVSGVRSVKCYVARPAAIAAAIEKFYEGNQKAFDPLLEPDFAASDYQAMDFAADVLGPPPSVSKPGRRAAAEPASDFADPFNAIIGPPDEAPRSPRARSRPPAPPPPPPGADPILVDGLIPADDIVLSSAPAARPPPPPPKRGGVTAEDYLETLNVFVSLLEQDRGQLRGHSGQVARICRLVADRAGLQAAQRDALVAAAYLHDVGKVSGNYHLTALNVARYEGHRAQAQKTRLTPVKLFSSARLTEETTRILAHMYERFDGNGFPDRLAGKDIPYGARVLSIVETYTDLTSNERNPYRRQLSQGQALSVVRELSGQLFDPAIADLLVLLAAEEKADDASRSRALLVDPDAEETTVLELRLIEHGFVVDIARSFEAAVAQLERAPPQVVVTEIDLGGGRDGFALLEHVRASDAAERPAMIVFTQRADRDSVSRGFDLGAADYLVKPASAELVATKAGQAVDRAMGAAPGGVSGSIKEMSLPDVIQILSNGRRSGRLQLAGGGKRGEIHFKDGLIHDARFGTAAGEEAVYEMLKLTDGTFQLDPSFKTGERVIHASAEGLLLEGMRRIDEGI